MFSSVVDQRGSGMRGDKAERPGGAWQRPGVRHRVVLKPPCAPPGRAAAGKDPGMTT